ncbi:hypothetical protein JHS3_11920 [Jeongeupia sp. HS-3]|uniref:hypothetical protein n=1 Tax=Jeongeupia sp. HS-3 TaxID=1009682 RepID=UPI0018A53D53|nr:hypothetical protein [Jeongeupia sp. HS-3]BCL75456.1 hypothetical protein JHS3_11920 [Jeongeupia sp. HS-3]
MAAHHSSYIKNRWRHYAAVLVLLALSACANVNGNGPETTVSGNIDVGIGIQR